MTRIAKDYLVLHTPPVNSRVSVAVPRKPVRVGCLLVPLEAFVAGGCVMRHNENIFLDERLHDWDWRDGRLSYYSHALASDVQIAEDGQPRKPFDVLVVFEEDVRP